MPENAFPRAAFGLPIVFHFKDEKDGEPNDHYLEPADIGNTSDGTGKRERMASPLILRPYWNGKAWQAAALLLPGWEEACSVPLKFKDKTYTPPQWPKSLEQREQYSANIMPMTHHDGTLRGTDPLTAFLDYFQENA